MTKNFLQEKFVVVYAQQDGVLYSTCELAAGLLAVLTPADNFRQHGVIKWRNGLSRLHSVINADSLPGWQLPLRDAARLGHKVFAWILRVQANFHRVTRQLNILLLQG